MSPTKTLAELPFGTVGWLRPSGPVTITTEGSGFDTMLGVYTGTSVSGLSIIARNDDEGTPGVLTSKVTFSAVGGTIYRIAVDGYNQNGGPGTGNIVLNLNHTSTAASLQLTLSSYSVAESAALRRLQYFAPVQPVERLRLITRRAIQRHLTTAV